MSSVTSGRRELVQQLQRLGVETVTAEYDGSGDSGQIDVPEFGAVKVPDALATAVQDLFYDVLGDLYAGWEVNEGSFGEFEWDVKQNRINLVHNARIESCETEEQVL